MFRYMSFENKRIRLAFDTGSSDTAHDVFAEDDEEKEQRNRDKDGSSHLVAITGDTRIGICEGRASQTIGYQAIAWVIGDKVRPDIGVPGSHELQNGDGDKGRHDKRDDDFPKERPIRLSIHLAGKIELIRNLLDILSEKVDVEDGNPERNNHGSIGFKPCLTRSYPSEGCDGDIVGNDHHFTRNHHGGKEDHEESFPAFELQSSKGIAGKDGGDQST